MNRVTVLLPLADFAHADRVERVLERLGQHFEEPGLEN